MDYKRIPDADGLASQPTLSRFFNRMDKDTLTQFDDIDLRNYKIINNNEGRKFNDTISDWENILIDEENLSQDMLREFCSGEHENDVFCVSRKGIKVYINVEDIRNQRIDEGCYELLQENVFSNIYSNPHNNGIIPLLDPVEREPIALAKYIETSYQHNYNCDVERIDTAIFDLYESICIYEVNEFSVLMYQQCFKSYKGKIVLFGDKWKYILPYLGAAPEYADLVVISDELALKQEIADKKTMRLSTFASNVAGYRERCEAGWFHINEWRKRILQEPETTLGILIRGTDYVAVRPKGHAVQATPEQIIEKIKELSKEERCFKNIL